jgi:CubicO group peptidase (beta-lactamase class C family)
MTRSRMKAGALLAAISMIASTACTARTPAESPAACQGTYPCADWQRTDAAAAGFDEAALAAIAADAERNDSTCLVVTRHGKIAGEWYWYGAGTTSTSDVFSATKSYTSTLIGIAQAEGRLSIDDKVSRYIPEWAGTPSADVTIRDILSNDSGRHWSQQDDYRGLLTARNRTRYAIGLGQDAPPGTTWVYNNSAIQTLDAVLTKAIGESPARYAKTRLFDRIGMSHSAMSEDHAGNTDMFTGLKSTCEDMARFGYLFLRGGQWNDTQIVPADWVRAATGQPSQNLNAAYGYLWWLNRRGPVLSPRQATTGQPGQNQANGQLAPDAPQDMYWAAGFGGQIIQIDPGSDTVVVRLGQPYGRSQTVYGPADTAKVVTQARVA